MDTQITLEKFSKTKCIDSFKENVIFNPERVENLISFCIDSQVDEVLCRPIAWRLALDVVDKNKALSQWVDTINKQRLEYKKKVKAYCSVKKFAGDPLGSAAKGGKKEKDNNWGVFHETNKLKDLINLDLSRTYQEIDLFQQVKIKNMLATILFVWAKENETPSYQQGMSDIIGVFFIAFYPYYCKNTTKPKLTSQDIASFFLDRQLTESHVDDIYTFFHDEDYLEADLYFVFDKMMQKGVKDLFNKITLSKTDPLYRKFEIFPEDWKDESDEDVPSFINRRCNLLVKEKLKKLDDELFTHFRRIDLSCNIFLQRWLRCAFNHEFDSKQILVIWDAIFGNENPSEDKYPLIYMDYFALAMFFRIRKDLLNGEQNDCFTSLFRYPKVEHIEDLVSLANKVKQAINDNLNGKQTLVYEVLFIPRPLSANNITPHMYNQLENHYAPSKENKQAKQTENNQTGNEIESESGFFGGKIMSSLGSFGGMIKEKVQQASEKIGEKIEQIKADNNINSFGEVISNFVNPNQQQMDNYENNNNNYYNNEQSSNYYEDSTENNEEYQVDSHNILNTLTRINAKYHMFMDVKDKEELRAIIQFFKDNITD